MASLQIPMLNLGLAHLNLNLLLKETPSLRGMLHADAWRLEQVGPDGPVHKPVATAMKVGENGRSEMAEDRRGP